MPSFRIEELAGSDYGRASDVGETHLKKPIGRNATVGRPDKRLTAETITLIRTFMWTQKKPVLMVDILDHLGRKPSPHLRKIMDDFVNSGEFVRTMDWGAGPSIPRYWYSLP